MSFESLGLAIALYDYRGSTDEELNFYEGDVFVILDDGHEEWTYVQVLAYSSTQICSIRE